jgi:hypothetical protein
VQDEIVKAMFAAPESIPDFVVGQTVRVISRIDVNMPRELDYWLNSKCEVIAVVARGFICRDWSYKLLHENGHTCEFRKEELDLRYKRRKAA